MADFENARRKNAQIIAFSSDWVTESAIKSVTFPHVNLIEATVTSIL